MKHVQLGAWALSVSRQGLGCMGMSTAYGDADDRESTATIHRALDLGVNFLDTADVYGDGKNERLVGKAISGRRSEVVLATKFGHVWRGGSRGTVDGSPGYVRRCCEDSLRRLGTDFIDLYYQHRVDPNTPIEDTVGAMTTLIEQGKIGHIGLSEASAQTIRRANAVHPITAVQSEYSLWSRDIEDEVLAACRELGIGFVAYCPLGRGFLTDATIKLENLTEDDWRRARPRFEKRNLEKYRVLTAVLKHVAGRHKCTSAQLALAWLHGRGPDVVPIPGTKRRAYLEQNAGAVSIELTDDDLAILDDAFRPENIQGDRYSEQDMQKVNI